MLGVSEAFPVLNAENIFRMLVIIIYAEILVSMLAISGDQRPGSCTERAQWSEKMCSLFQERLRLQIPLCPIHVTFV